MRQGSAPRNRADHVLESLEARQLMSVSPTIIKPVIVTPGGPNGTPVPGFVADTVFDVQRGYYTSAVFFPVTARGNAGLRIMLRSDNSPDDIRQFCETVGELVSRESSDLVGV